MKNKQNKRLFEIFLIFGILLINFSLISAMGFSTAYDSNYPFVIAPGETKDMSIMLSSTEPVKAGITLTSGSEVATIIDSSNEYNVAPSTNVNLRIKIPEGVAEGTKYKVSLLARDITPASGTVSLAGEVGVGFTVLVQKPAPVETPAPTQAEEEGISTMWWVLGIIAVIAIIAVIWFVVKGKKEEA